MANDTKAHGHRAKFITTPTTYIGLDLRKIAMRPNSLDVLNKPSRIDNTLFYPDGTILKDATCK
jgi:hypothetical protein